MCAFYQMNVVTEKRHTPIVVICYSKFDTICVPIIIYFSQFEENFWKALEKLVRPYNLVRPSRMKLHARHS